MRNRPRQLGNGFPNDEISGVVRWCEAFFSPNSVHFLLKYHALEFGCGVDGQAVDVFSSFCFAPMEKKASRQWVKAPKWQFSRPDLNFALAWQ